MAVFAANVTDETVELIEAVLNTEDLTNFAKRNNLVLSDKTILIRLALINLYQNLPSGDEITSYKAALLRPHEFDDYLRKILGVEVDE